MSKIFTRRIVITALTLALAVCGIAGFATQDADASLQELEHIYYSDASHTQIVGLWIRTCWGAVYTTGTKTQFKETTYSPCY